MTDIAQSKTTIAGRGEPRVGRSGPAALVVCRALSRIRSGQLLLELPDGRARTFGNAGSGPVANLRVRDRSFFRRVLAGGAIGLGEAYMAGEWETDDLTAVLVVLARNRGHMAWVDRGLDLVREVQDRLRHSRRRNSLSKAASNIAEHYDLSNAFYQTFLDGSLSYSAGLYEGRDLSLEKAQENKIRRVLELSGIQPGQRLLEIGSGWGALAICAARDFDCRVVTITLSEAQYQLAGDRIRRAGLADRIDLRLMDYRHLQEQADALVSVEMIEAVGHAYLPAYFSTLARCLRPGGRAVLQAITMPDDRYAAYRRSTDFIQKHIFPGGHLPSPGVLRDHVSATPGLSLDSMTGFGPDYARTLAAWHRRFRAARSQVEELGFSTTFRRKWAFYLSFCEAGFREDLIDVQHVVLRKKASERDAY